MTRDKPTTRILIHFRLQELRWAVPDAQLAELKQRFPQAEFVQEIDDARAARAIEDVDIFFGWTLPEEMLARAKKLKWFQSANAGVDRNLYPAMVQSPVQLTNSAGAHAVNIPEHVIGAMLIMARNFNVAARLQLDRRWDRGAVISAAGGIAELENSTALIVGVGAIGAGLAGKLAALGMQVAVVRRSTRQLPGVRCNPAGELDRLLPEADFVILALPLTNETRHLFSASRLALIKPGAYLINIARGEVIDEPALIAALQGGAIAGAALDVFAEEPLPASSPLWGLPNVVLTPHVAGASPKYFERIVALFADNLERHLKGLPLHNLVDKQLGYASPN